MTIYDATPLMGVAGKPREYSGVPENMADLYDWFATCPVWPRIAAALNISPALQPGNDNHNERESVSGGLVVGRVDPLTANHQARAVGMVWQVTLLDPATIGEINARRLLIAVNEDGTRGAVLANTLNARPLLTDDEALAVVRGDQGYGPAAEFPS